MHVNQYMQYIHSCSNALIAINNVHPRTNCKKSYTCMQLKRQNNLIPLRYEPPDVISSVDLMHTHAIVLLLTIAVIGILLECF